MSMLRSVFSLATLGIGWALAAGAQPVLEADDPAFTERRVALVIGNGAYGPTTTPLRNPTNDARDMATALGAVGFEVTLKLDVDRDQMRRAVIEFGRSLREGGVGLFYFSGHAVQLAGNNYMIPIGAEVDTEDYVEVETVEINDVLARMGGADNRLNIVILDACRNNPFKGIFRAVTRGLAQTLAPSGTFLAYAAAPGQLALDGKGTRNSPYTTALLQTLEEPGLRLEDVFKRTRIKVLESTDGYQTPWTGSSITGEFYFRLPEPIQARPTPSRVTATDPAPDVMFWSAVRDSRTAGDFETFLEVYPDSVLVPLARRRLRDLQLSTETAALEPERALGPEPASGPVIDHAAIERALDLSRDQRREIQFALAELGHDPGSIDGILGERSRAAIGAWQRAGGDQPTRYLTESQVAALVDTVDPAELASLWAQAGDSESERMLALFRGGAIGQGDLGRFLEQRRAAPAVGVGSRTPGPSSVFRDCPACPEMVVVPAGAFTMGSPPDEPGRDEDEEPQHRVSISRPFAVGKYEVTFAEWDACEADGGCDHQADDQGWGRDDRPAINVSWDDAKRYVAWLSRKTRASYRLLSEAEWEYVGRAGSSTIYWWGQHLGRGYADCDGCGSQWDNQQTAAVGRFDANAFGVHDTTGNVWEWIEDCWHDNYDDAPTDGSAWSSGGDCGRRILRGGSWNNEPWLVRSAARAWSLPGYRSGTIGFRVARTIG